MNLSYSPLQCLLQNKYFVATEAAIIIINIDLDNLKFEGQICSSIVMPNGENLFKRNLEIRGICASKNYLYTIQFGGSGPFLCLKYHKDKNNIEYVYAD